MTQLRISEIVKSDGVAPDSETGSGGKDRRSRYSPEREASVRKEDVVVGCEGVKGPLSCDAVGAGVLLLEAIVLLRLNENLGLVIVETRNSSSVSSNADIA